MVRSIHHINFIVRDLEAAVASYERILGRPVDARDELVERGVITARFRLGETWLVLVQPTRPGTAPADYLAQNGEGFFLLSLEVDSLATEADRLGEQAFSSGLRSGLDDWVVRDLNPGSTCGAQLQYVVPGRERDL